MAKQAKEHVFKGSIIAKNYIGIYQGRLKGQGYYNLTVNTTPKIWNNTIQAIREKILDDKTWDDILTDKWIKKKYWLICHKYGHTHKLVRWEEIESKTKAKV